MKKFAFLVAGLAATSGVVGMANLTSADHKPAEATLSLSSLLADPRYSPEQKEIISDGLVTDEEFNSAFRSMSDCVQAQVGVGLKIKFTSDGNFQYGASIPNGTGRQTFVAARDECEKANFEGVNFVYAYARRLTPERQAQIDRDMAECLQAAGVEPGASSDRELSVEADCYDQAVKQS